MSERPILFNDAMVRAILSGAKTQTRRPVHDCWGVENGTPWTAAPAGLACTGRKNISCPFGRVGDSLWVREAFDPIYPQDPHYHGGSPIEYDYRATYQHGYRLGDSIGIKKRWTPSIHMPREASRITLEITGVRVERLQDISEADALAEGITSVRTQAWDREHFPVWRHEFDEACAAGTRPPVGPLPSHAYRALWESIYGHGSWGDTSWVWVIEFKRAEAA